MHIRFEQSDEGRDIHALHRAAFGSTVEADIVDALCRAGAAFISIVAEDGGAIVGHILFSPVTIAGSERLRIVALGPLAVHPDRQRRGFGSGLVKAGLEACRRSGVEAVFVVGHPEYYPRFGFIPASAVGMSCEFEVLDEAFMVLELIPGALRGRAGVVRFHDAFTAS